MSSIANIGGGVLGGGLLATLLLVGSHHAIELILADSHGASGVSHNGFGQGVGEFDDSASATLDWLRVFGAIALTLSSAVSNC